MAKLFSKLNQRRFLLWIVPPLAFVLIKLLYFTCKKKFHINTNGSHMPSIYAFWHGELLMLPLAYIDYAHKTSLDAMISRHFDGELIAKLILLLGGGSIRGSSSKGGTEALRAAIRSLRNGRDVAITPDGPRGPRHSVAEGVVAIAAMKKVPIITMNCKPSRYWKLKSWDEFCIPKPFSTLEFYFGDPFFIHEMSMDEAKALIKNKLLEHAL